MPEPNQTNESFVSKIVTDPANPPDLFRITGYRGASSENEHTRLYGNPELSVYWDIPEQDVAHEVPVAAEADPLGAVTLWVKRDSKIIPHVGKASQPQAAQPEGTVTTAATLATLTHTIGPSVVDICTLPSRTELCVPVSRFCTTIGQTPVTTFNTPVTTLQTGTPVEAYAQAAPQAAAQGVAVAPTPLPACDTSIVFYCHPSPLVVCHRPTQVTCISVQIRCTAVTIHTPVTTLQAQAAGAGYAQAAPQYLPTPTPATIHGSYVPALCTLPPRSIEILCAPSVDAICRPTTFTNTLTTYQTYAAHAAAPQGLPQTLLTVHASLPVTACTTAVRSAEILCPPSADTICRQPTITTYATNETYGQAAAPQYGQAAAPQGLPLTLATIHPSLPLPACTVVRSAEIPCAPSVQYVCPTRTILTLGTYGGTYY